MTHSVPRRPRPHYLARLWAELGRMGGEHDAFIKVIIEEACSVHTSIGDQEAFQAIQDEQEGFAVEDGE